ncbi:hypothetical protein OAN307_c34770 [Octadecabacter antarcticus 307]|uniref:Hedgehog/Intein (Hint) domain-containing protein n=1 Tax=Octadecabacter antarcticus 307 TaxID=391626 RepID=M9RGN9_9RHOB|nr:hypothetical protein OAN307_c34770 [Octadecabacter antarcticus 307]
MHTLKLRVEKDMRLENTQDFKNGSVVKSANVSGLATGTNVITLNGELPVEHLNAGDRIIELRPCSRTLG